MNPSQKREAMEVNYDDKMNPQSFSMHFDPALGILSKTVQSPMRGRPGSGRIGSGRVSYGRVGSGRSGLGRNRAYPDKGSSKRGSMRGTMRGSTRGSSAMAMAMRNVSKSDPNMLPQINVRPQLKRANEPKTWL